MLRSALALLLPLLWLCCAPPPIAAQSSAPSSISVLVQTFGHAHADIPVTLHIQSSALDSDISSPADLPTNMTFANLRPGAYHILASSPDRAPAQLDLTLTNGQSVQLTLIVDRVFPLTLQLSSSSATPASASTPAPDPSAPLTKDSTTPSTADVPAAPPAATPEGAATSEPDPSFALSSAKSTGASDFVKPCSLNDVLPHVSANIEQFVDNVNRITATELVNLERRRHDGKLEDRAHSTVSYVADIQLQSSGYMTVDEYRNGHPGMTAFEGYVSVSGSTALILIFHPIHLSEFAITCRGLLEWQGAPAYVLSFQQRIDRPNTMSEFRNASGSYPIHLKGLAWVDPKTFEVVHLETDLLVPIPQVALYRAHQAVDYGPVPFPARQLTLWLPLQSDIDVGRRGKQFNEHHSYSGYQLFAIDTNEKIASPKQTPAEAEPPPAETNQPSTEPRPSITQTKDAPADPAKLAHEESQEHTHEQSPQPAPEQPPTPIPN